METKYKEKYNFDLDENIQPKDIILTETSENTKELENPILKEVRNPNENTNVTPLKVIFEKEEDIKKDILLSKPYPEILRKKIILNINLLKLYLNNFYYEEFELSRNCLYFTSSFPILTYLLMTIKFIDHPLRRTIIVFNTLFSFGLFIYFYQRDIIESAKRDTDLGMKVT